MCCSLSHVLCRVRAASTYSFRTSRQRGGCHCLHRRVRYSVCRLRALLASFLIWMLWK
jgi:hypothetical protein